MAQVFAISINNIQYKAKKEAKVKTNPKNIIFKKHYNFLDIISKKNSNTFF